MSSKLREKRQPNQYYFILKFLYIFTVNLKVTAPPGADRTYYW